MAGTYLDYRYEPMMPLGRLRFARLFAAKRSCVPDGAGERGLPVRRMPIPPSTPTPERACAVPAFAQALAFEHGEGVPQDTDKAAQMYCEAARLGNAEAMPSLGWMYANGRGVERSDPLAGTLFAMAACRGHAHAEKMARFTGEYQASSGMHEPAESERTPDVDRKWNYDAYSNLAQGEARDRQARGFARAEVQHRPGTGARHREHRIELRPCRGFA